MSVTSEHSAAGPLAGYLFQPERALYRLATSARGSVVGIETLDDVVVRSPDGFTIYEQDKHSIGQGSPLAETKAEMWKAFHIWLQCIAIGEIDPTCSEFHLVTNKIVTSGFCSMLLEEVRSPSRIEQIVCSLRCVGKNASKSVQPFVSAVLAYSDENLAELFAHVRVVDGSKNSSGLDLKLALANMLPLPKGKEEQILQSLLGWVHDTVLELIRQRKPAWLSREAFNERYLILVSRFQDQRFLNETAEALIPVGVDKRNQHQHRLFVRQLLWLGFPENDEQLIDAIDDFIRSSSERIRLAESGTATIADFREFEARLVTRWKNIFRSSGSAQEESECQHQGKNTLYKTLDHREPLAGFQTQEYYLTRGAYHRLADCPPAQPKIGWHPQFQDRCRKEEPTA